MRPVFELIRDDVTPKLRLFAEAGPNIKRHVLGVIAAKFKTITIENFGYSGIARTEEWPPLSNSPAGRKYQRKVVRSVATLEYSEDLFRSFRIDVSPDYADFYSISDYAGTHQYGDESRNIPARPFAPTIGVPGNEVVNDYANAEIINAVNQELQRLFDGGKLTAIY